MFLGNPWESGKGTCFPEKKQLIEYIIQYMMIIYL
jgi:hypothetical protein